MECVQVQHTVTFADITRPDDAVQYAAGEVVSDSTSAATAMRRRARWVARKALRASPAEVALNPRARSARLRVMEKL